VADSAAFFLGLVNALEGFEKSVLGSDDVKVGFEMVGELRQYSSLLIFSQQAIVN
jgi:hypothetical protein